jgi:sulfur carrier protein ThiS adenylyltransferase
MALARVGVGNMVIADFDIIELFNLNRQYYFSDQLGNMKVIALKDNLRKVNPKINLAALNLKLNPDLVKQHYADCDVIVEAFDKADEKQWLIETVQTEWPEKPIVIGIGMAGWGGSNEIHVRQEGNLYIVGDEKAEVSEELPPIAPRVGIVANMQANVVLEILLKDLK